MHSHLHQNTCLQIILYRNRLSGPLPPFVNNRSVGDQVLNFKRFVALLYLPLKAVLLQITVKC